MSAPPAAASIRSRRPGWPSWRSRPAGTTISTKISSPSASGTASIGCCGTSAPTAASGSRPAARDRATCTSTASRRSPWPTLAKWPIPPGREPDDRYRQAAQQALRFIEYVQHNDGGWRYTEDRDQASDTSVSGWQVLALHAAQRARIVEVREECVRQVEEFFKRCELGQSGRTGYMPRSNLTDATTGVGMLVHEFLLEQPDSALVKEGARYLADRAEQPGKKVPGLRRRWAAADGDFYTWYNCTLAMFQAGGEPWKRWNNVVRDTLVQRQRQDPESCMRGSWDPHGQGAGEGGRIYSTALAVLTLEVYYRYKSERARVYAK